MAITPDPITRKKLLLVKQLYQHAVIQARSTYSMVNRIMAIIGFDLASETLLKAVVVALEQSKTPGADITALVQQADSLLAQHGFDALPDKSNIVHVHSLRNDAQHKAKYPNESDVADCRIYTRDFLRRVMASIWALDLENFTLVDTIENTKARQFLLDAEAALARQDYDEAVAQAAAALTWALENVKAHMVGDCSPLG